MESGATGHAASPTLDAPAVASWLGEVGIRLAPPLEANFLTGGRSNLTFALRDGRGRVVVVRRPPLGALLQTAHDVRREWRFLAALDPTPVPVPAPLALCEDDTVIGAPFLVMSYVHGRVLHRRADAELLPTGERATAAWSLIDALAVLHQVDPASVGLATEVADRYLARQIDRWRDQNEASATAAGRKVPGAIVEGAHRLRSSLPAASSIGIVHGDFRLGNAILADDGRVSAVVDWEMATVGAVLADLGWLLATWYEAGEAQTKSSPTSLDGFPTRRELVQRYAERTDVGLADLDWFVALGQWKAAGVLAGVAARTESGAYGAKRDTSHIHANAESMALTALDVLDGRISYLA